MGEWSIEKYTIGENSVERIRSIIREGERRDPGFGRFTRLVYRNRVGFPTTWMSDTRAEILEHEPLWNRAKILRRDHGPFTAVVNGLGMGMAIHGLLKLGAAHIDVVEVNPKVIELISPYFEGKPVTIHEGDALTYEWPANKRWELAWHDIWPEIDLVNAPEMERLHRRYGGRVITQESWSRVEMKNRLEIERREARIISALMGQG